MIHTEDEAKKLWCPFARVVTYDKHASDFKAGVTVGMCAANKTSEGGIRVGAYCIASACMAWRASAALDNHGYCGLAGKP